MFFLSQKVDMYIKTKQKCDISSEEHSEKDSFYYNVHEHYFIIIFVTADTLYKILRGLSMVKTLTDLTKLLSTSR